MDSYSESYEGAHKDTRNPIRELFITVLIMLVFWMAFEIGQSSEASADVEIPQGVMGKGWVVCWNKSNGYEGTGRIMWDYESIECVEVKGQ